MIKHLLGPVYYGDKNSVRESLGQFQSVINVAHSLRRPYWRGLNSLDYHVWYFRLALHDRELADSGYLTGLGQIVDAIQSANKLPVLCHCRIGGHRGPSSAIFVYWHLSGRTIQALEEALSVVKESQPHFDRHTTRRQYRVSVLDYCLSFSSNRD